jgi:hypothetical protein
MYNMRTLAIAVAILLILIVLYLHGKTEYGVVSSVKSAATEPGDDPEREEAIEVVSNILVRSHFLAQGDPLFLRSNLDIEAISRDVRNLTHPDNPNPIAEIQTVADIAADGHLSEDSFKKMVMEATGGKLTLPNDRLGGTLNPTVLTASRLPVRDDTVSKSGASIFTSSMKSEPSYVSKVESIVDPSVDISPEDIRAMEALADINPDLAADLSGGNCKRAIKG